MLGESDHSRHNQTTYDACYLALAEALDAPLYTCDRNAELSTPSEPTFVCRQFGGKVLSVRLT